MAQLVDTWFCYDDSLHDLQLITGKCNMKMKYLAICLLTVFFSNAVVNAGQSPANLHCYKGTTPVIDGVISRGEYDDAVSFNSRDWIDQFGSISDYNDLSVIGWTKHDGTNLYFAFDISDNVLYGFDTPRWVPPENPEHVHDFSKASYPWFGDAIELLINATNTWPKEDNTFNYGDARSWQVVCNHSKSLLAGIKKGGLIQGEQRDNPVAWENHEKWIRSGAMKAVTKVKPDKSGYIVEWMITPECLQVSEGKTWSPELGLVKIGLNIAIQDLDDYNAAPANWGRFNHELWWTGEKDKQTWPKQWGTLFLHPDEKSLSFHVSSNGNDSDEGTISKPFATIQRAKQAVRAVINKAQNVNDSITVWIHQGIYRLETPLIFTEYDSGSQDLKVIYSAWPGDKPVISGGRPIKNWKHNGNNLWSAQIEDVKNGKWFFRELFVDGKRLTRARYPNESEENIIVKQINDDLADNQIIRQTYELNKSFPNSKLSFENAEFVIFHIWSISRQRVAASENTSVRTEWPAGWIGHTGTSPMVGSHCYLENSSAFIDLPGEWFLDKDNASLLYKASNDQNPNDQSFIAPYANQLLNVKGTREKPVTNLHFKGISFEHSGWIMPLKGYNGIQAGCYGTRYTNAPTFMLPVAILFEYANSCSFETCRLSHTGASGLGIGAGCSDNLIQGCEFFNVGGNAIVVGWRHQKDSLADDWQDILDSPKYNIIKNNHIRHCAAVQFDTVGYFESFSQDTLFSHNLIHDMPYTGISVGFSWTNNWTTQSHSTIEYNHIYNVMQLLADGAAIYTLGNQPGTVIRNNYIHDVKNGHGFYSDEGSAHILFENNVISRVGIWGYFNHTGRYNTLRNNIFCSAGKYSVFHINAGNEPSFTFERNIVLMDRYNETIFKWQPEDINNTGNMFNRKASKNNFKMDYNIYWDTRNKDIKFAGMPVDVWQNVEGQDKNSLIADPEFFDPEHDNFSIAEDSPAIKTGFKPIDISKCGPEGVK